MWVPQDKSSGKSNRKVNSLFVWVKIIFELKFLLLNGAGLASSNLKSKNARSAG
jgi:hypothetical protein